MIYICSIIKNEHQYLEEWIDYHLNLGFDGIYLVEDVTSKSHSNITDQYDNVYLYKLSELFGNLINRQSVQRDVANYFSMTLKHGWLAFIDIDEFIMSYEDINDIVDKYSSEIGIKMPWKNFNSNGHKERQFSTLLHYTQPCPIIEQDNTFNVKCFGNMDKLCVWTGPHDVIGAKRVEEIWVNHYITRSFEDYCFKIFERGDVYFRVYRNLEAYLQMNPDFDEEWCKEQIQKKYNTLDEFVDNYESTLPYTPVIFGHRFEIFQDSILVGPYACKINLPCFISTDVGKIQVREGTGKYKIKFHNFYMVLDCPECNTEEEHYITMITEDGQKKVLLVKRWISQDSLI